MIALQITDSNLPRSLVVRSPEEASSRENAYDYVILCVKALPDVYDLASVIESVVTPQHTCIIVNTTSTIGVEAHLEQRYPTNVVLSLVSGVEISQTGVSEFEHLGSTTLWVGSTSKNTAIPASIQSDMAYALSMTLCSGQVDCKLSENIRQEQFEGMIGCVVSPGDLDHLLQVIADQNLSRSPIAFHPVSVLFECSNHSQLLDKVGVRQLVSEVIDELLDLARAQGCTFPADFRQTTIQKMVSAPDATPSIMYQDFQSRRPMEVETYLGSPIKLATECGVRVPRIETLYALLHHVNIVNQNRPRLGETPSPSVPVPPPTQRMSSAPPPQRAPLNGALRASRTTSAMSGMMPMAGRRGPPSMGNGMPRPPSVHQAAVNGKLPREPSVEGLEEFSHLILYDDAATDGAQSMQNGSNGYGGDTPGGPPPSASAADLALRERELALRQREMQLREQEMGMRRGGGPRRGAPSRRPEFDEEDEDDYFDPMDALPIPHVDPDSVDMLSITSRRTRKAPTASQLRGLPEMAGGGPGGSRPGSSFSRYFGGRKRASDRIVQEIPSLHDSLFDNSLMGCSSNRYGSVDRNQMHVDSRANSLTASRMGDYPPHPYPQSRRNSGSPATGFGGPGRPMGRPGPPPDPSLGPPNGYHPRGNPSPPGNMRAPVPRHPPGHGNTLAPQQVEQQFGVSNPYPGKVPPKHRSLTGSASASAESGDSGASASLDFENSAHSSQISLGPNHAAMPVR